MKPSHQDYMDKAIKLALRAKGKTSPNPLVGAVVVNRGRIIGEGFHAKSGLAHAEVIALDEAGERAKGATLYVTLEPCAHYGKTPPCVDRIIKSGITHVIVGMIDPNPKNNGKGIELLRRHGVRVEVGFSEERLQHINESFIKYITTHMPFVTVKVAQSLDGRIATRRGDSQWITSDIARTYAHRIRQDYDGIMVGVNTVLRDNPRLDSWFSRRHPAKIIVDSGLSVSAQSHIFLGGKKVILVTLAAKSGQETENRK
ncbi:MAG: bifunctional diaminohydroxyphosphoribosylaminopyrimidine deaminase/5-amino-6-(5-phosphoribosylamino)uracil reductase RibD, partial [Candidatus Omnitrophica bacterium]|nr:bifunctional diaminohydroxyphosphoribosylaminopyrimidine deaminase/5-amino-6-(5-phosphoribosylamino)uracil reductase RibD [Candidatus Omnitrophota bacterium]